MIPMRAGEAPEDLADIKYPVLASPKLDGIGCVVIDGVAYSRKMKPIPNAFVQSVLKDLPTGFHGELIVGDPRKPNTWNKAQSGVMSRAGKPKFTFMVFDWWHAFADSPYEKRFELLRKWMMQNATDFYRYVPHTIIKNADELRTRADAFLAQGYEGLMIRSLKGPYKQGRSTTREGYLLKVKPFRDAEATVIGFEEEMENTNPKTTNELGKSKRSKHKAGMKPKGTLGALEARWGEVEFTVSGFTDEMAQAIWDNQRRYLGKTFTFTYQMLTVNGKPRHPQFKGWRKD